MKVTFRKRLEPPVVFAHLTVLRVPTIYCPELHGHLVSPECIRAHWNLWVKVSSCEIRSRLRGAPFLGRSE